ncbi:MAG: diguanylate cyclase, partial [Pseudomonadota bacterium]
MLAPMLSAAHYAFNPHAVPLFTTAAVILLLGVLTVAREKGSRAAPPLTVLLLGLFIWVFGYAWMYLATDPAVAMGWGRLAHAGIILIPAATYHFTVVVADRAAQFKIGLRMVWGITALFIALCFGTDWFLGAPERYPWSYHPRYGWAGLAFVIFLALIWLIDIRIFWQAYRRAPPGSNTRRRTKYLGLLFTMGIFGGVDFAPAFGVPLIPLGYLGVALLTVSVAYVTWRYRLIDITPAFAAQKIIETINDGLVLLDTDGVVRFANQTACGMLGYDPAGILGARLGEALGLKSATLQTLLDGKPLNHYETAYPHPNGVASHLGISTSLMRDRDGTPATFVCVLRDITENKQAEEQIRQLAYYDSLTQLPNREHFRQRLAAALVAARQGNHQLAILFLDLDHFKRINDSLGHSVGDQLLHLVAERLRQSVRDAAHSGSPTRDNESLVARLGGDEFVIVAYPIGRAEEARQIAERLLRIFLRPFRLQDHEVFVGASIGISLFPNDGANAEDLLKHADTAMYVAKGAGRGGHQIYDAQMSVGANERFSLESALHAAIDEEQLLLHYQPQFDVHR